MTPFQIGVLILGAILALSAVIATVRIVVGPTILDRAVASDYYVVICVIALALVSAWTRSTLYLTAMLALTGLAFIGTISLARFVSRQDSAQPPAPDRDTPRSGWKGGFREPPTVTGSHEAIHPDMGSHTTPAAHPEERS